MCSNPRGNRIEISVSVRLLESETMDLLLQRYYRTLDNVWAKLPNHLGSSIASVAIFLMGISIRADWLFFTAHLNRHWNLLVGNSPDEDGNSLNDSPAYLSLEYFKLQGLSSYITGGLIFSFTIYLTTGLFLHWYFYVRQRDQAEEWKCQPTKWTPPEVERHSIILGSICVIIGSSMNSILSCYVNNGGWSRLYYGIADYGYVWAILQWPLLYMWLDYLVYWSHRLHHTPLLYKMFHKMHHKYKQPTAWSAPANHPIEFTFNQCLLMSCMFLFPIHWVTLVTILAYNYYHSIIDHSGVNFKTFWWQPWQPPSIFHDNHHQYFHVNFGFNMDLWDKLHGTYRQKDRMYREDLYYGQGKSLSEATTEELMEEVAERQSENPRAFASNEHEFELSMADVKKIQ